MTKGWRHESGRHALAARGIKSTDGNTLADEEVLNRVLIRQTAQFRVPEGIVRDGDFDFVYQDGKCYRVTVRLEVTEERR